ncbi:hypothetical protein BJV77DRAFT_1068867 [Russula vinacea]|nr:hypothetical protein BJV77DRAFT_1068867 [Russula vinacea]
MTVSPIAPAVRAARCLSPSTCSKIWWRTTVSRPERSLRRLVLPSISTSKILRSTCEAALRTPGIKWLDEDGKSPLQNTIGGRETRKMNVY